MKIKVVIDNTPEMINHFINEQKKNTFLSFLSLFSKLMVDSNFRMIPISMSSLLHQTLYHSNSYGLLVNQVKLEKGIDKDLLQIDINANLFDKIMKLSNEKQKYCVLIIQLLVVTDILLNQEFCDKFFSLLYQRKSFFQSKYVIFVNINDDDIYYENPKKLENIKKIISLKTNFKLFSFQVQRLKSPISFKKIEELIKEIPFQFKKINKSMIVKSRIQKSFLYSQIKFKDFEKSIYADEILLQKRGLNSEFVSETKIKKIHYKRIKSKKNIFKNNFKEIFEKTWENYTQNKLKDHEITETETKNEFINDADNVFDKFANQFDDKFKNHKSKIMKLEEVFEINKNIFEKIGSSTFSLLKKLKHIN